MKSDIPTFDWLMDYVKAETRGRQPEIGLNNSLQLLLASHYLKVIMIPPVTTTTWCGMHMVAHVLCQGIDQRVAARSTYTEPCVGAATQVASACALEHSSIACTC